MDRRTKYTKKIIKDTLIRLLSEKDIKKVTVSEICKENGHAMLKSAVELAGNVEITVLSLPLIKEIIDKAGIILGL